MKTLPQLIRQYLAENAALGAKSSLTLLKERGHLAVWAALLGDRALDAITPADIRQVAMARRAQGVSARTVNLDILALSNLFKWAKIAGLFSGEPPTQHWQPLPHRSPKRDLLPVELLQAFVRAARQSARLQDILIADFVEFCAYTGARRNSALRATWEAVDFARQQVVLTEGTKYGKTIRVDFNPSLRQLLTDMAGRRRSRWLFPSPSDPERFMARPERYRDEVCRRAGLPVFRFHDLRHYFISQAVMAGVDFMTIAAWVGHADGGLLVGKVYGHLSDRHKKQAAMALPELIPVARG